MRHKEPTLEQVEKELRDIQIPGMTLEKKRVPYPECNTYHSHIYLGDYDELIEPLCPYGWHKGGGFSIWRNNVGRGICRRCLKKAHQMRVNSIRALNKSNAERN